MVVGGASLWSADRTKKRGTVITIGCPVSPSEVDIKGRNTSKPLAKFSKHTHNKLLLGSTPDRNHSIF